MTDTTHPVDQLVADTHHELDPSSEARITTLTARLHGEQDSRAGLAATDISRVRRARRPRVVAAAIACACAAAVFAAVALAPTGNDGGDTHLPAPATARAALLAAADAAGDADWKPLGPGEYVHTVTRGYVPKIPEVGDVFTADPTRISTRPNTSSERWLDRSGHVTFVSAPWDTDSPEYPAGATISVMSWPRTGPASYHRAWMVARTTDTVTKIGESAMSNRGSDDLRQFAKTPIELIDAANEHESPDRAVADLIGSHLTNRRANIRIVNPEVVVPRSQLDREEGIEYAVNLLGEAPLSPAVRNALFRWLAAQPGADIVHDVSDEEGRSGTEVTFQDVVDRDVPAYTTTARDALPTHLKHNPSAADGVSDAELDRSYTVTDNREHRRWLVTFIIDLTRGELLQQASVLQERVTGARPTFNGTHVDKAFTFRDPMSTHTSASAQVYLVRERTKDTTATLPICQKFPRACR